MRIVGYILFGLLVFPVFLYLTFPFAPLQSHLAQWLAAQSGCRIVVQSQSMRFPLHPVWEGIVADCPDGPGSPYSIASVDVALIPWPLLWGGTGSGDFHIHLAQGRLTGRLAMTRTPDGFVLALTHQGRGVDLKQIGASGLLDAEGEAHWQNAGGWAGGGHLSFTLQSLHLLKVGAWVSPVGALDFARVTGRASWRGGVLTFDRVVAEGSQVDFSLTGGQMLPRAPLAQSILSLTVQVTPKGSLKPLATAFVPDYAGEGPIQVTLSGSLERPDLFFDGKSGT